MALSKEPAAFMADACVRRFMNQQLLVKYSCMKENQKMLWMGKLWQQDEQIDYQALPRK